MVRLGVIADQALCHARAGAALAPSLAKKATRRADQRSVIRQAADLAAGYGEDA
jgi:hypothetical protein